MPHVKNFDKSQLIIGDPEENDFEKFKCAFGYEGEVDSPQCVPKDGKWKKDDEYVHIQLPPMFCFGVSKSYTIGKPQTDEFFDGYQICVQMTSRETVDAPTEDEQATNAFNEGMQEAVKDWLIQHKEDLPDLLKSQSDDKLRSMVTTPFQYQKKKVDKNAPVPPKGKKKPNREFDTTKPKRAFLPLIYTKKFDKINTVFFGPGDVKVDPLKYLGKYGTIEPVVRLSWLFFGDKTISVKMHITEANFTPLKRQEDFQRRLGPNTAAKEDDIDDEDDDFPRDNAQKKDLQPSTTYNPMQENTNDETPNYQYKMLKDGRKVKVNIATGKKTLVKE